MTIINAKAAYFISENVNTPLKFWKTIQLLNGKDTDSDPPPLTYIIKDNEKFDKKNEIHSILLIPKMLLKL